MLYPYTRAIRYKYNLFFNNLSKYPALFPVFQNIFCVYVLFIDKNNRIMTNFLFPKPPRSTGYSRLLLVLRIFFGLMLAMHGIDKLANYTELVYSFPDPFGFGSEMSLLLTIFGEIGCSVAFIIGFLYRLAMIPMIFVMGVAFFQIHQGNIGQGELAFIYLIVFIFMFFSGPGKYSVDATIYKHIHRKGEE